VVPRYLIFLNIFITLGIAASYSFFLSLTQNKMIAPMIIFILVITSIPFLSSYYSGYSKDDWRGFSSTLSEMTQPNDSIIIVPGYVSQPLNYYYSNATDKTIEYLAYNETQLTEFRKLQTTNTYYIVTGDIQSANPNGDALQWINTNTKQVLRNNNIYVFRS
jgi:mannosyltransferase